MGARIFQMLFMHQLKWLCVFFFVLLKWRITLTSFCMFTHAFWGKSHLVVVCNPFNLLLNSVCKYVLRNFKSVFVTEQAMGSLPVSPTGKNSGRSVQWKGKWIFYSKAVQFEIMPGFCLKACFLKTPKENHLATLCQLSSRLHQKPLLLPKSTML